MESVDVGLHDALHLLGLLLLLSTFSCNFSLQSLNVGDGPMQDRSELSCRSVPGSWFGFYGSVVCG